MLNNSIFRAYDVRGKYPEEIDPETTYRITCGFVKFLKKDKKKTLPMTVMLGQDMRGSSPFLAREVTRALTDQGVDVVDIGKVSTPAFYFATSFRECAGGIMVTASHMSREYNGLKMTLEKVYPIGQDTGLMQIQKYAAEEPEKISPRGSFTSLEGITRDYVSQDLSYLNFGKIHKFKIVADPGNGMGATYLEEFFKQIPCEPIKINWELNGNMPVHEANPIKLETLQQIQAVILNEKADLGIATDGDGDRIAFLDENAAVIPVATVTKLIGRQLAKKNTIDTVGFFKECKPKEFAKHAFAGLDGGRYFFRENFYYDSPVFAAAQLLLLKSESENPMFTFSELIGLESK